MRFDSFHPAIQLFYFVCVITCTVCFRHPVFLLLSFSCAFACSAALRGVPALRFNLWMLPLAVLIAVWYSSFHHFGVTNLRENLIGNYLTLEALAYGLALGCVCAAVLMWLSCVMAVLTADKTVYLFGRISPRLSLFLAILLRLVPRIKAQAVRIHTAQRGIGRGINQGNPLQRGHNLLRVVSILITWTLESLVTVSDSMRSRGGSLGGRTAYSLYRFDHRDRCFVAALFTCLTVALMGAGLGQNNIRYNPRILMNRVTPLSFLFYAGYLALCLLPAAVQLLAELRWQRRPKHF